MKDVMNLIFRKFENRKKVYIKNNTKYLYNNLIN